MNNSTADNQKSGVKGKKIYIIFAIAALCIAIAVVLFFVLNKGNNTNDTIDIKNAKVGDIITLGKYEQDNNMSNGKEDIEWIVLDKKEGKLFVVSKYILDCRRYYNRPFEDITWEESRIREWLNDGFINSSFSESEKAMIPTVTVDADDNKLYSNDFVKPTEDKVFLLSTSESEKYFKSATDRKGYLTAYATANCAYEDDIDSYEWWLRSHASSDYSATFVNILGSADRQGRNVINVCGVRPALWINLNS